MENKTTNRAKMSYKRCIKVARLQYLQRGYKASEATSVTSHLFCFTLAVFLADLLDSDFFPNNKIDFSLANANNSASFKSKWFETDGFYSFTNNKQSCE